MTKKNPKKIIILLAAFALWIATFFTEPVLFDVAQRTERLVHYITFRVLFFVCLTLIVSFVYNVISSFADKKPGCEAWSLIYAVPLWIFIFVYWKFKANLLIGSEEMSIIRDALAYKTVNGVFTYITSYYNMMAMMLIPSVCAPIIIKIIILGLTCGYAVFRLRRVLPSVFAYLIYFAFIFPPSLHLSYSAHRTPMYGLLYLFLAVKLICDYMEKKEFTRRDLITLSVIIAVLTVWRTEGIYMLVLGPVVTAFAYRIKVKKTVAGLVGAVLFFEIIAFVPKTYEEPLTIENYGKHQITPFYNYVITNMLLNGLDREKYSSELETVENYLHIDFIDIMGAEHGEHIMDEGYATYDYMYRTVNPDATEEILSDYESTVLHLIFKEPWLFITGQLRAFNHISTHYGRLCLSSLFGNLWVVVAIVLALMIWALVKKNWFFFVLSLCPLAHGAITTVLLPAAYFKYYYPEYLFVWFIIALAASYFIKKPKKG